MMIQKKPIIRKATTEEANLIEDYVNKYFGLEAQKYMQQFSFWIKQGNVREVFVLGENVETIVEKISAYVYSVGIPIGSFWGSKFQIEVEGSALLFSRTSKKVTVKTDQFLYGKHVFVENIETISSDFSKGDMVLVVGKNSLHYGVGKVEINSDEIQNAPTNSILIKGSRDKPLDRGWYLRRGN
ncbi:hypothetical protein EU534_00630 [Candidatus Heimdallarchaeota archaeon]|nr:MAG: hypothetical protein EU534_00630 [Candidatus Heimdallarchaeota archaeon]